MPRHLEFFSFSNKGYEGQVIHVETDIRNGFPGFDIIGLPDTAIKESRERVKTALRNCGFKFPQQRVLVSLSPASVPKSGSLLDLGIALSILFAGQNRKTENTIKIMAAGELTLDGNIIQDYSAIGAVEAARKTGCKLCLVPFSNGKSDNVIQVTNLTEAFLKSGAFINSSHKDSTMESDKHFQNSNTTIFADIIGLEREKEIITLSAAGRHSILLFGPPGVGKTMLCSRIIRLMDDLNTEDLNNVYHIYGCAGLDKTDCRPPFRAISHDCSMIQFTGGQSSKTPGEGALAHCGVLQLDEITSYSRKLLESVKDTYDKGFTVTSRSGELITYPAMFLMSATMNACPCGKLGNENEACSCTSQKIINHWNKVGTPLLERFDIKLPVKMQDIKTHLSNKQIPDSYYTDKIRIAKKRQQERFKNYKDVRFNGQIHIDSFNTLNIFDKEIGKYCTFMKDRIPSNTREVLSIVALARTIADTEDRAEVCEEDFLKAGELRKYGNGDYFWRTIR